jgi:hypothetical protein
MAQCDAGLNRNASCRSNKVTVPHRPCEAVHQAQQTRFLTSASEQARRAYRSDGEIAPGTPQFAAFSSRPASIASICKAMYLE